MHALEAFEVRYSSYLDAFFNNKNYETNTFLKASIGNRRLKKLLFRLILEDHSA